MTGCLDFLPLDADGNRTDGRVKTRWPNLRVTDLIAKSAAGQEVFAQAHWGEGSPRVSKGIVYDRRALENQQVCVYTIKAGSWKPLSSDQTNAAGKFKIPVSSLPVGLNKLYLYLVRDHSGSAFRVLIANEDTKLVVTDVDGTLTEFELPQRHHIPGGHGLYTISNIRENIQAPESLQNLSRRGYQIVYLTTRAEGAAGVTRRWLLEHHFPDGVLLLVPTSMGIPPKYLGGNPAKYKTRAIMQIRNSAKISAGIGNQPTDQEAYSRIGLSPEQIFISINDCHGIGELRGKACVFDSYKDLLADKFDGKFSGALKCTFIDSTPAVPPEKPNHTK